MKVEGNEERERKIMKKRELRKGMKDENENIAIIKKENGAGKRRL